MKKFMSWLSESFAPKVKQVFSNPWIAAVATTMQKILPFILVGSVISLYNTLLLIWPDLPDLTMINTFSFGMLSVIVAFMVPHQAMEELKHYNYKITCGLTGICAYFIMIGAEINAENIFSTQMNRFGGAGLLVAMLTGLFVALIFHLYAKLHVLEDSVSVPDFVVEWINNIIPITIILGICSVLIFNLKIDVFGLINQLFSPVTSFGQTLPGFIMISFIYALLYTLGISAWSFNAVATPILLAGIEGNAANVAAGLAATNIVTTETMMTCAFIALGGIGATLPLNLMMLRAKSKKNRTLGKICLIPSLSNINEPLVYGLPIVFNPLLMLPMWINSIIGPVIVWITMSGGLVNVPAAVNRISRIPAPISSVLVTEDMRAIVLWAVLFAVYAVVYYPFFKVYDKECALKEEQEAIKQKEAQAKKVVDKDLVEV